MTWLSNSIALTCDTEEVFFEVLFMGTYQVQTNLSVQTIKTSIWTIRSSSKGRGAERWEGGFVKVWLPNNPRAGPDYKITQSPIPFGCWFNDSDWSFHSLHREIGLHMIRCHYLLLKLVWSWTNGRATINEVFCKQFGVWLNNEKTTQRLANQYFASPHNVTFVRMQKQNIT